MHHINDFMLASERADQDRRIRNRWLIAAAVLVFVAGLVTGYFVR